MAIVGFILFVLGLIMLIYAPIHARQNKRRTETVTGTITFVKEVLQKNSSIGHPMYDYFFTVDYIVDGITHTTHSPRWSTRMNVGDEVTVCYNPNKADDSHIKEFHGDSSKPILIVALILLALGLLLFVIGVIK